MKCPFCGEVNTKVIDSRPADDNNSIRRRRKCEKCGKRFTTYEKLETIPLVVIKKDEAREPYDRSKIERGVFRSCTKRPISVDQINELVDSVESTVFNLGEKEVPSSQIGEILMDKLQKLDSVAYVRFASVYRDFKDVSTFMDEIKKILDQQGN
ncbi:MAG: transcriptional repressor NrdR [Lachnospiraceae bacterium]|nr:transcriptional repressor NrdR [Lachnospiraceae bacterium]